MKKIFQKVNNPDFSFKDLSNPNLEEEWKEALGNGDVKDAESLDLFLKILEKYQDINHEFVDKWVKREIKPDEQEIERLGRIGGWEGGGFIYYLEELEKKNSQVFEFTGNKKRLENLIQESKEIRKKIIDNLIKHERERVQSNQNDSTQSISPKSQNQPSNKSSYPWGIIIGMGTVIAALLGMIVFLLIKNKNKKRVK